MALPLPSVAPATATSSSSSSSSAPAVVTVNTNADANDAVAEPPRPELNAAPSHDDSSSGEEEILEEGQ